MTSCFWIVRLTIPLFFIGLCNFANAGDDPNFTIGEASVLYEEAGGLEGNERIAKLRDVNELLIHIEEDHPDSIFAGFIRDGRKIGSIDIKALRKELEEASSANDVLIQADAAIDRLVAEIQKEAETLGSVSTAPEAFQTLISLADILEKLNTLAPAVREQVIQQAFAVDKWSATLTPDSVAAIKTRALNAEISSYAIVGTWVADAFLETKGEPWLRDQLGDNRWAEELVQGTYQLVDYVGAVAAPVMTGTVSSANVYLYAAAKLAEIWVAYDELMREYDALVSQAISSAQIRLATLETIESYDYEAFLSDLSGLSSAATDMMTGDFRGSGFNVETGRKLYIVNGLQGIRARQIEGLESRSDIELLEAQIAEFDETPGTVLGRLSQPVTSLVSTSNQYLIFGQDVARILGVAFSDNHGEPVNGKPLTGTWSGYATAGASQIDYLWTIHQSNSLTVEGTISLKWPSDTEWKTYNFQGELEGDQLSFRGTSWVTGSNSTFCIAAGTLTLIEDSGFLSLSGTWGPLDIPGGCPRGTGGRIELSQNAPSQEEKQNFTDEKIGQGTSQSTFPDYWVKSSESTSTIITGETDKGLTIHPDNSVTWNGQTALPPVASVNPTNASAQFSPDGTIAIIFQTFYPSGSGWSERLAVVFYETGRRPIVLEPADVFRFGRGSRWSSDGRFLVSTYDFNEFENDLLVFDLKTDAMFRVRSDRPAEQVSSVDLSSLRSEGSGIHSVRFRHLACPNDNPNCGMATIDDAGETEVRFQLELSTTSITTPADTTSNSAPLLAALKDGVYGVDASVCDLDQSLLGDQWGSFYKMIDKPKFSVGWERMCSISSANETGDTVEVIAMCNTEGKIREDTFRWRIKGETTFTDLTAIGGPKNYIFCQKLDSAENTPVRVWTKDIVIDQAKFPMVCSEGVTAVNEECLIRENVSPDTIAFIRARETEGGSGPVVPVHFQELGQVDIVHLATFSAAGTTYPYFVNTSPETITYPLYAESSLHILASRGVSTARSILRSFPSADVYHRFVGGMRKLPDGGQRFSTIIPWTESCRACPIAGMHVATVDFDTTGRFRSFGVQGILDARPLGGKFRYELADVQTHPSLVQYLLNIRGYNAGAMDGAIGPVTRKAIAEFQKENGINSGTGQLDARTYARLADSDTLFQNGLEGSATSALQAGIENTSLPGCSRPGEALTSRAVMDAFSEGVVTYAGNQGAVASVQHKYGRFTAENEFTTWSGIQNGTEFQYRERARVTNGKICYHNGNFEFCDAVNSCLSDEALYILTPYEGQSSYVVDIQKPDTGGAGPEDDFDFTRSMNLIWTNALQGVVGTLKIGGKLEEDGLTLTVLELTGAHNPNAQANPVEPNATIDFRLWATPRRDCDGCKPTSGSFMSAPNILLRSNVLSGPVGPNSAFVPRDILEQNDLLSVALFGSDNRIYLSDLELDINNLLGLRSSGDNLSSANSSDGTFTAPSGYQWVQLASRQSLSEAQSFAASVGGDARIFRSSNGWYAVVGTLLYETEYLAGISDLVSYNGWPADSYLTPGEGYVEAVPSQAGAAVPLPLFTYTHTLRATDVQSRYWRDSQAVYTFIRTATAGENVVVWGQPDERGDCLVDGHEGIFIKCKDIAGYNSPQGSNTPLVEFSVEGETVSNEAPYMDLATPQLSYDIGEPIVVENLFSYGDPNGLDDIDRISVRLTSGDGYLYLEGGNSPESTTVSVRTDELSTLRFVARSSLPNVVLEIEVQDQAAEIERETLRLDFNELDGWDALIAAISFPQTSFGFFGNREMTDLEQRLVLVQLQKLYELSPIARTTLDNFVNNGGTFEIYGSNDATAEFKSNLTGSFGAVILNLNYALSKEYVNVEGGFSVYGIGQIIFHEMLHAIDWAEGNPDPIIEDENLKLSDIPFDQPDFDHLGHVIRTVNTVREEIGDVPLRGSYKPTPTGDVKAYIEYLKQYIPWTFDQAIIFFRDLSNDDPEAANPQLFRSDGSDFTRDLVYGLNRRNEIIVGSASDMVFGAGGDDMIDLGDGEDRGMGLGGNDIIKGGNGFDQAIYQNSITAYTIYVNGFGEIVVNHDGAGQVDKNDGTDRLTQVEEAVFSDATLDLASFRKAVLAPSETASFRYTVEEFDGLDVSESNGGDTLEFVNVNFDERSLTVTYGFAIR